MTISSQQLETIKLSDYVVIDVSADEYSSGFGISVDNSSHEISVKIDDINHSLTSLADPFVLSSDVEQRIAKDAVTYLSGVQKIGRVVQANYDQISSQLKSFKDPFTVSSDVIESLAKKLTGKEFNFGKIDDVVYALSAVVESFGGKCTYAT